MGEISTVSENYLSSVFGVSHLNLFDHTPKMCNYSPFLLYHHGLEHIRLKEAKINDGNKKRN